MIPKSLLLPGIHELEMEGAAMEGSARLAVVPGAALAVWEPWADQLLSAEELGYWKTREFAKRKESFFLGRVAAKAALVALTGIAPKTIEVAGGILRQPVVKGVGPVGVSISHTASGAIAVAFPLTHPMGIDLESIDPSRVAAMAKYMAEPEKKRLDAAGAEAPALATVTWTAKEALAKVLQIGLGGSFAMMEIGEMRRMETDAWECSFAHVWSYIAWSRRISGQVVSLVFPKECQVRHGKTRTISSVLDG